MRFEHVRYPAVEAFDQAVGSGRSGSGQAVLDAQLLAQQVKLVLAAGLLLAAGKQAVVNALRRGVAMRVAQGLGPCSAP